MGSGQLSMYCIIVTYWGILPSVIFVGHKLGPIFPSMALTLGLIVRGYFFTVSDKTINFFKYHFSIFLLALSNFLPSGGS